MRPVVVVGSTAVDVRRLPDGTDERRLGGVTTYGGIAFRRAGLDVVVVCTLGGAHGARARAILDREGLDVRAGDTEDMTIFTSAAGAPGGELYITHRARPVTLEAVASDLDGPVDVHLGPLHPEDIDPRILATLSSRKRRGDAIVALDLQGYVRSGAAGPVAAVVSKHLEAALVAADVVKAERAELDLVLRHAGLTLQDFAAKHDLREVVVTDGANGGCVATGTAPPVGYAAVAVAGPIDPTGAGDVFFATYLAWRHHRGATIADAAARASAVAASHVAGKFIAAGTLRLSGGGC